MNRIDDTTMDMLVALAEACEGRMEVNYDGITAITTNGDLEVTVEMADGRRLRPEECDARQLENAVFEWRQQHPGFFQRILGAMM